MMAPTFHLIGGFMIAASAVFALHALWETEYIKSKFEAHQVSGVWRHLYCCLCDALVVQYLLLTYMW